MRSSNKESNENIDLVELIDDRSCINPKSKESQNAKIRKHLEEGKSVTPLYAVYKWGILRLSARIFDLKEMGMNITTTMVKRNGKRFAEYKLEK